MGVREAADGRRRLTPTSPAPRTEVARLVADLGEGDGAARASAVARLRVIGSRAVSALERTVTAGASTTARIAALGALEGIDDPRAADVALAALADSDVAVVVAALGVLRAWVTRETDTRILERLTVLALDKDQAGAVRLAALDALSDLPRGLVQPILERAPVSECEVPSDEPTAVRDWLTRHETAAPLSELHDVLVRARDRERTDDDTIRGREWLAARGAVHLALARRGSRIALYDLRETFDRTTAPLPPDFATAVSLVGDAECLESLARAWAAARDDSWWRTRLAECASDVKQRLRLTGHHAVLKRLRAKWPGFV